MRKLSGKTWLSIITFVLVAVVIYLSRHQLVHAWQLLGSVNIWILLLLLPLQFLSYYAAGAMIFTYLKDKYDIRIPGTEAAKMALELNFVNHILPSGGVSGASYMTWRLSHMGVGAGRATLTQVVRLAMTFMAFLALMILAVIAITLDGDINRFLILVTSGLASTIVFGTLVVIYIVKSRTRLHTASNGIVRQVNRFGKHVLRRQTPLLDHDKTLQFFEDLHCDYCELAKSPRVLVRPFWWGIVFTLADVSLFWITFLALGTPINPAPLLIAYGVAGLAGVFVFTPGGVGGYEALMVGFLATTGISQGAIIAAVLLTRTLLILVTIVTGYYFYQKALNKYGKQDSDGSDDTPS
ncbi:flippase-like domain-containing protein [Candidatus Saccharibacteria bacterium]|nr:flippase-like domain-containing protein [Candidatus Saccharibacteria bacterium]